MSPPLLTASWTAGVNRRLEATSLFLCGFRFGGRTVIATYLAPGCPGVVASMDVDGWATRLIAVGISPVHRLRTGSENDGGRDV